MIIYGYHINYLKYTNDIPALNSLDICCLILIYETTITDLPLYTHSL